MRPWLYSAAGRGRRQARLARRGRRSRSDRDHRRCPARQQRCGVGRAGCRSRRGCRCPSGVGPHARPTAARNRRLRSGSPGNRCRREHYDGIPGNAVGDSAQQPAYRVGACAGRGHHAALSGAAWVLGGAGRHVGTVQQRVDHRHEARACGDRHDHRVRDRSGVDRNPRRGPAGVVAVVSDSRVRVGLRAGGGVLYRRAGRVHDDGAGDLQLDRPDGLAGRAGAHRGHCGRRGGRP